MKALLLGAMIIGAMSAQVAAQALITETGGGEQISTHLVGTVVAQPAGDAVTGLVILNPRRWGLRPWGTRNGDRGYRDWGYASDPYFHPEEYDDAYLAPSTILVTPVIQQAVAPPVPTPPPTPARPEMHEYQWPSSDSGSSATTYSIVSKDGVVHSATLVWIQGKTLCYRTSDDSTGRIPIDSIDRDATRHRNGERQLLWLPPESQTNLVLVSGGD